MDAPDHGRPAARRASICAGLLVLFGTALFAPGFVDNVDSRTCLHSARSLLDHGSFAILDPDEHDLRLEWAARGPDGLVYSKFGIGPTIILVPFVAVGRLLARLLPDMQIPWDEVACSFSSCVFAALAAGLMVGLLVRELNLSAGSALLAVLGWMFGTFQAVYAGSTYRETALAMFVVATTFAALAARRKDSLWLALLAGVSSGCLMLTKSAYVVCVPFLLLPLLRRPFARSGLRLAATAMPIALAGTAILYTNLRWLGSVAATGYVTQPEVFTTPIVAGLREYAANPDLSLPLFAPAFMLALAGLPALGRRRPLVLLAASGVFASLTLIHAAFAAPGGGTAFGPRYLVASISLLTPLGLGALLETTRHSLRSAVLVLVGLAVLTQIPSLLVPPYEYHTIRAGLVRDGTGMSGLPPHLLLNLRLLRLKLTGQTTEYPVGELVDASSDRVYQVPVSEQGLHTWWLLAGRRGIRVWPAAALLGGLLLLLSIHAARLVREYRPPIEQQRRRS